MDKKGISKFFQPDPNSLKRKRLPSDTEPAESPRSVQEPTPSKSERSQCYPLSDDKFDPILDAPFKYGEPVPFSFLVSALILVESAKGKDTKSLQKQVMANLFRSIIVLKKEDLVKCFYLTIGSLCPEYMGVELGIGKETLFKVVASYSGLDLKAVREKESAEGDLGTVASKAKHTQKNIINYFSRQTNPAPLTVSGVYEALWRVANFKGTSSAQQKENELKKILNSSTASESKYVIRIAQKSLKIGASELTMQSALARAVAMTPPKQNSFPPKVLKTPHFERTLDETEQVLKKAINQCPDYDKIIGTLLEIGPDGEPITYLAEICKITPGLPVKAMLAQPTKGIHEVLNRFNNIEFTCEFKYDGMRAQIHVMPNREIRIYSRNAENISEMYPDVIQLISTNLVASQITDCILDSEVVAFDSKTHKIRAFQEIQHRGRKNVNINAIEVEVCVFLFDMLYLNGESLLDLSLADRRGFLFREVKEVPGKLTFVQSQDASSFEDIETLLMDSIKIGCEGLMIKTLHENASYEPAKRSLNWLKLKKDYISNSESRLSDTVDLVPIGAYFGTGRRTGVYGSYLLAVYDSNNDEYQSICKAGSGFSDDTLQELFTTLSEAKVNAPLHNYRTLFNDLDVWFAPICVWEILGADLSVSPKHTSAWGVVQEGKGISLRFPRFIKARADKKPVESTSPEQIVQMYWSQSAIE